MNIHTVCCLRLLCKGQLVEVHEFGDVMKSRCIELSKSALLFLTNLTLDSAFYYNVHIIYNTRAVSMATQNSGFKFAT